MLIRFGFGCCSKAPIRAGLARIVTAASYDVILRHQHLPSAFSSAFDALRNVVHLRIFAVLWIAGIWAYRLLGDLVFLRMQALVLRLRRGVRPSFVQFAI